MDFSPASTAIPLLQNAAPESVQAICTVEVASPMSEISAPRRWQKSHAAV